MSSFSRFKELNQTRINAEKRRNTTFVFTAYNSIDLTLFKSLDTTVRASVVNQQEKDQAYIYTEINHPLDIGSIWGAKGLYWIITEEIVQIKDVNWHKYLAFLCNIDIADTKGYWIGPEKHFINVTLREKVVLQSLQHPVLIIAGSPYNIDDKILVGNRGWVIQEMDNVSSPGVTYYSLRQTTMSKDVLEQNKDYEEPREVEPQFIATPTVESGVFKIGPNVPITLSTENGYFKYSNKMINIITHTENIVSFSLPYGVSEVEIEIQLDDEIITRVYKQVV